MASCESLFDLRGFKPFFEQYAMDVAIIDGPWNGIWQSLKIAAMAEAYEINVAPHNFYGHLSTLMSIAYIHCQSPAESGFSPDKALVQGLTKWTSSTTYRT